MTPTRPKLFVLGFPRSGAERIKTALGSLGFRLAEIATPATARLAEGKGGDPGKMLQTLAHTTAERADGLYGAPLPFLSEALDRIYPGSRFILPVFDPAVWLAEHDSQFRARDSALTRWMFGTETFAGNEEVWAGVVADRFARIREQFRDRPSDLLELDLAAGDGWLELVSFLGRDILPPLPEPVERTVSRTAPSARPAAVGIVTERPPRAPRPPKGAGGRSHAAASEGQDRPVRQKTERVDTRGFAADADRPRRPQAAAPDRPEGRDKSGPSGRIPREDKPFQRRSPESADKPERQEKPDRPGRPQRGGKPFRKDRSDGAGKPALRGKPTGSFRPHGSARPEGEGGPTRPDRPHRPGGPNKHAGSGKPFGGPKSGPRKGPGNGTGRSGGAGPSGGGKSHRGGKPGGGRSGPRRDS